MKLWGHGLRVSALTLGQSRRGIWFGGLLGETTYRELSQQSMKAKGRMWDLPATKEFEVLWLCTG